MISNIGPPGDTDIETIMINGSTQADTTCRKVYIEGIPKAFEYSGKRSIGIWRTRVMNILGGTIPEAEEAKLQGYVDGKNFPTVRAPD